MNWYKVAFDQFWQQEISIENVMKLNKNWRVCWDLLGMSGDKKGEFLEGLPMFWGLLT